MEETGSHAAERGTQRADHVAIIMDGNGRWARQRLQPRRAGHAAGLVAVRRTVDAAQEFGLGYLTLYAFSTENWRRPKSEVAHLMSLLQQYFESDIARLKSKDIRVRVIGSRESLTAPIAHILESAESVTAACRGLNLTFAFNYGAREEIAAAARLIARAAAAGTLDPESVTPETVDAHLLTAGLPDPDLVIRTSGERRLSNFLLWQAAYAEFLFLDVLWPDFSREHLRNALEEYAHRERRFGGIDDEEIAAGTRISRLADVD